MCNSNGVLSGLENTPLHPLAVVSPTGVYLLDFVCAGIQFYVMLSHCLCAISFLHLDLYVVGDDA